ncbi:MAG: hypothetical protein ACFFGZ_18005 [Candidatus Thorarchaeota archaeon]
MEKIDLSKKKFSEELAIFLNKIINSRLQGPAGHIFRGITEEIRENAFQMRILLHNAEKRLNEYTEFIDFIEAEIIQKTDDPLRSVFVWQYFFDTLVQKLSDHLLFEPEYKIVLMKYFLGQANTELFYVKPFWNIRIPTISVHVALDHMSDDVLEFLTTYSDNPMTSTTLLEEIGLSGAMLTLEILEKTQAFRLPYDNLKTRPLMENSNAYRWEFEFDIKTLRPKKRKQILVKWEYKMLLVQLLEWINEKVARRMLEIVLYSENNGEIILNRVHLVKENCRKRQKKEIYKDILKILEDYARNLPRRQGTGGQGTFGLKPLGFITYKGISFKSVRMRLINYYSGYRPKAPVNQKSKNWVKSKLKPLPYTARKEIEVVKSLMSMKAQIKREKPPKKLSRRGNDLFELITRLYYDLVSLKMRIEQQLHHDLNKGGSKGGIADLLIDPDTDLINGSSDPYLSTEKRLELLKASKSRLLLKKEEIDSIRDSLEDYTTLSNTKWTDEQIIGIIADYFFMYKLKTIIKDNNSISSEIRELFADAFSGKPKKYKFRPSQGIGERYGPRARGNESRWIIDHVVVFEVIEEGHEKGKIKLVYINDKNWDGMATKNLIAKDIRNMYNLMLNIFKNHENKPLLLTQKGKAHNGIASYLLSGPERNNWKQIQEYYQKRKVVDHYGIMRVFKVVESTLQSNKQKKEILFDVQVFKPEKLRIGTNLDSF